MKKFFFHLLPAFFLLLTQSCGENISATVEKSAASGYLTIDDVVNSGELLSPPPDSGSAVWAVDVERYHTGKNLRDTERGQQAIRDAFVETDSLAQSFSAAFGYEISKAATPAVYRILDRVREDAGDLATRHAKQLYMRHRPFVVFNEPTPLPGQEEELRNNGSYPSGHSAIGYAVALVLSEINPQRAMEIMRRGYDFGESRVILGFHFDSDVRAGRMCASAVVSVLHSRQEFLQDIKAARQEIAALGSKG